MVYRGGDGRDRTDDLLNAIQALSQLSYAPIQSLFRTNVILTDDPGLVNNYFSKTSSFFTEPRGKPRGSVMAFTE